MERKERLKFLQEKIVEQKLGAVLLFYSRDVFYYTGTAQPSYLFVSPEEHILFIKRGLEFALDEKIAVAMMFAMMFVFSPQASAQMMGPGMMGQGGYGMMGPGMMGQGGYGMMGPSMMGRGMGPGMMGPGQGVGPQSQYGTSQQKQLTEKDARGILENYLKGTRNPNLKLGKIIYYRV